MPRNVISLGCGHHQLVWSLRGSTQKSMRPWLHCAFYQRDHQLAGEPVNLVSEGHANLCRIAYSADDISCGHGASVLLLPI